MKTMSVIKKAVMPAVMALGMTFGASAENKMYFQDFDISAGETKDVLIYMDHDVEMCSFQAQIYLPEGLSIATNTKGKYKLSIVEDRIDDHILSSALQSDGSVMMLAVSLTNSTYYGVSGDAIVSCTLVADDTFEGTHTIELKNIIMNDPAATKFVSVDTSATINGNATGVEDVLSGADGEAEYYNLQGMKVEKPENGVFIKKQGGKATKVIL